MRSFPKAYTRPIYILILSACVLIASGCNSSPKEPPLEEITALLESGDFATAKAVAKTMPEDEFFAPVSRETIAAAEAYEAGNWLEAARLFESLSARTVKNKKQFVLDTATSLAIKIDAVNKEKGIETIHELGKRPEDYGQGPGNYADCFYNCLYYYYDEQYRQGNELTELTEYPLIIPDGVKLSNGIFIGADDTVYQNWSWYVREWCKYRNDMMSERIETSPGLFEYYRKTDDSVSPVDVSGEGIYINTADAPRCTIDYLIGVFPFAYATEPEDIRYIVNFSQEHSYHAMYDNGTKAYVTFTTITIKDTKTGEILLSNEHMTMPSDTITYLEGQTQGYDTDEYAWFKLVGYRTEARDEIMPVLSPRVRLIE